MASDSAPDTASPSRAAGAEKTPPRILIYLLRRDLRLNDNPIFSSEVTKAFATATDEQQRQSGGEGNGVSIQKPRYTHFLPLYVFPAQHVEVSGFLREKSPSDERAIRNPYPPARSQVGNFWRCGPHRAKFMAESVWDLKTSLQDVGSDLVVRAGLVEDVISDAVRWVSEQESEGEGGKAEVAGVWMTRDEAAEEKQEERAVRRVVEKKGIEFRTFQDEKYYIDE